MQYQNLSDQPTAPMGQPAQVVYVQQPVYVIPQQQQPGGGPPSYAVVGQPQPVVYQQQQPQRTEGQPLNMTPAGTGQAQPSYGGGYQTQPMGQPASAGGYQQNTGGPNVVVVQQANMGMSPAANIMINGLCGCFDDLPTCCLAYFCPPCAAGMNASRVNIGNCFVYCLCYALFPCCVGAHLHSQISLLAGAGDPGCCVGCCLHIWCTCCVLSQEGRATTKLFETGMVMSRT